MKFAYMTLLAALFSLTASAQVYSVNIVGFNKTPIAAAGDLRIMSTPFTGPSMTIQEIIGDQLDGNDFFFFSDRIYIFDHLDPSPHYIILYKKANGTWSYTSTPGKTDGDPSTEVLGPGTAFWIENAAGTADEVITVGEVVTDATVTIPIVEGIQLISYPYSSKVNIQTMTFKDLGVANAFFFFADRLYYFDPDLQEYVILYLGLDGANPTWLHFDGPNKDLPATFDLNPGEGFWYQHLSTGFNWVEAIPYQSALQ